ncbi:hypothetical protein BUV99_13745 [Corynebacterium diphtheriae]|nr:hypothetical protein BUV99_13745 [Corynebacterium diphtheriae]
MLIFFASIGLSANFAKLREGGIGLVIFLNLLQVVWLQQLSLCWFIRSGAIALPRARNCKPVLC